MNGVVVECPECGGRPERVARRRQGWAVGKCNQNHEWFMFKEPEMDEHGPDAPPPAGDATASSRGRLYLPTLADLIDRMTIAQLKAIFIPEHRDSYRVELALIEHDVDLLLEERAATGQRITGSDVRAIALVMLTNRYIWENESKARAGGADQDKLLKLTHSINGVRNIAKNEIAKSGGERLDHKIDCFAAELVADFGNWNVF